MISRSLFNAVSHAATLSKIYRHGYSQHGDYVFGWKDDSLQRAMDLRCDGDVCSGLQRQSPEDAMKCTKARAVDEDIDGCKSEHRNMIFCLTHLTYSQGSPRSRVRP